MNKINAASRIQAVFNQANGAISSVQAAAFAALSDGKLFELYVLSEVLADLHLRGCPASFVGTSLAFKAGPGKIKLADPHFEVYPPRGPLLRLFVDIEFRTYGSQNQSTADNSFTHELDVVLTTQDSGYPVHNEIALAVECKSTANFKKTLLKEALGVRRELGLLARPRASYLSRWGCRPPVIVPAANPAAEVWFAYLDPKGSDYQISPRAFGIQFRHFPL